MLECMEMSQLEILRERAEQVGNTAWIELQPGQGMSVVLCVPAAQQRAAA